MRVAICQFNISWENKEKNKSKILSLLANRKLNKVDWIIFPEMTLSGFSMKRHLTHLDKRDLKFFKELSRRLSSFVSFGGIINNNNRIITLNKKGKVINQYSKIHLFSHLDEDGSYKPGNRLENFRVGNFSVSPAICYDLRFPYLFWPNAQKIDSYVVIANWPSSRRKHWLTLLSARAIENQAYIIGVNRIGKDLNARYTGNSVIINPHGDKILDCGNKEGVFTANLDNKSVTSARKRSPFLKDRRI